jgi:hypothetical protein
MAPCEHKIRVLKNDASHEIGIVKEGNQWALQADFWLHNDAGQSLVEAVGAQGGKLLQAYAVLEGVEAFQLNGFALAAQTTLPNGSVQCIFEI